MKKYIWLFFVVIGSACQRTPEVSPTTNPVQNLTEIGPNQLPINFYSVYLTARTSVNALTITSSVQFDASPVKIQEYGFCLSQTDSLPQITSPQSKRIKATIKQDETSFTRFEVTLTDLTRGQPYSIDPYVILKDGRVLYGRYNQLKRGATTAYSAIRFQLPERPVLQPVQLVSRASVPTPLGVGNTSAIPDYHKFVTLKGRLYSFYPTGALQVYDLNADRWEPMTNLGKNIFGTTYLVFPVDDKLYVYSSPYSGDGGAKPIPSMWEYDPDKNQWTDLGQSLGETLLNSRYQLSSSGKAYFYSSYPYTILSFDARQKKIEQAVKKNLLENMGPDSYVLTTNDLYYNAVWVPGGSVAVPGSIRTRIVQYNPTTDQVTEATALSTELNKQGYTNVNFFAAQGSDLLTGYGTVSSPIVRNGSVGAEGSLVKDELIRYSIPQQKITAYYDLSGIPNSLAFSQTPLVIGNRLFVFNASTDKGLLTEVIFK